MLYSSLRFGKQVDYVLIDTYSTANFWYAFAIAKICSTIKTPYIPLLHGGKLPQRLKKSPGACRFIFGRSYKNVAPSLYIFEAFKEKGYDNIIFIPNSINLKNYDFKKRETIEPRLLWARSFSRIYNPLLALKVFKLLITLYPSAKLCMIGPDKDGSLKRCKKYAEENTLDVRFTRLLSKNEWHKLSEEYDIFLNTTHYDNLPVSVLEAMAMGLPVISTDVGGLPFLLTHDKDSLLVGDDDAPGFVKAIGQLLENQSKGQKIIVAARTKAEEFDWAEVKNLWLALLR